MGLGRGGLAAWLTVAALAVAPLQPAHGQTTSTPTGPAATPKTAPSTTATKPAATRSATSTAPAKTTSTAPPKTTTSTAPAKTTTSTAPPKTTTSTAPAKSTAGTTTTKPATAAKPATSKEPAGTAKTTAPTAAKPAEPKSSAPKPAAPKPAAPATPAQQATPLRDATPTASALPGAPAPGMSFRQRHPLVSGFLTGLLGASLADALLGDEGPVTPTGTGAPTGNVLEPVAEGLTTAEKAGQLMRLAFFGGLVALAAVLWRRRMAEGAASVAARMRSAPGLSAWDELGRAVPEPEPGSLGRVDDLKAIADEQDFADILLVVQAAWSAGDVMAMRGHITPDMATYFDRRLAQNVDNGVENRVVDVSGIRVERLDEWDQDGLHYAKARMHWRALDYVIDMSKLPDEPGYIIDGSPENPIDCDEVWTFVKSPDGAWLLCEVEQGT